MLLPLFFSGPTVWSGAWSDTTAVEVGPISGVQKAPRWSSWIQRSIVTTASFVDNSAEVVATSRYEAAWSTTYATPTAEPAQS